MISGRELNLALASASFRVPEIPPGRYTVMFCDAGCAHPLADVIPTLPRQLTVTTPRTADGLQWAQKVGWLVVGVVLGAVLGLALGRLGGPVSAEPVATAWQPSDDEELEGLLSSHRPEDRVSADLN